jgi:hypothetical protein
MDVVGRIETYSFVFRKSVCQQATIHSRCRRCPASGAVGSIWPNPCSVHQPLPKRDPNESQRGNHPPRTAVAKRVLCTGASGLLSRDHCSPGNAGRYFPSRRHSCRHGDLAIHRTQHAEMEQRVTTYSVYGISASVNGIMSDNDLAQSSLLVMTSWPFGSAERLPRATRSLQGTQASVRLQASHDIRDQETGMRHRLQLPSSLVCASPSYRRSGRKRTKSLRLSLALFIPTTGGAPGDAPCHLPY